MIKPKRSPLAEADAARDAKDWRRAAENYKRFLAVRPERADIWVQYGHACKEVGRLEAAEQAYQTALGLEPGNADTHLQMGHLQKLLARMDRAAASYMRALDLDFSCADAVAELRSLRSQGVNVDRDRLTKAPAPAPAPEEAPLARSEVTHVAFDLSDLIKHFQSCRLPTGIQRVQIEIVSSLIRDPVPQTQVSACFCADAKDGWYELPPDLLLALASAAVSGAETGGSGWRRLLESVEAIVEFGRPMRFEGGAYLINLGSSSWLQNYFLNVRNAKLQSSIKYVPFVHDMVPIVMSEHCFRELRQDFIGWATGVFHHADHFLTNSNATRADLVGVAASAGLTLEAEDIPVVRLDADMRNGKVSTFDTDVLRKYGLAEGRYVLVVSTIESRKNHIGALNAWLELVRRHGAAKVPMLVCVGRRGWLNAGVFERLEASDVLKRKVLMLAEIPDHDLASLYLGSLFTLYPSRYEGWGLPVTESLCYGKVPLVSDAASLPEAGGEFAEYFETGSDRSLAAAAERLIFDSAHRSALEQKIAERFRPRTWRDLAEQILAQAKQWRDADRREADRAIRPAPITLGRYYQLSRNKDLAIGHGSISGEIFRSGRGWWQPEDWGCWTRGADAEIAFSPPSSQSPLRIYLGLAGLPDAEVDYEIESAGAVLLTGVLARGEQRWLCANVRPSSDQVKLTIRGLRTTSLSDTTDGRDRRVVSVGVIGLMACEEADTAARLGFMEAHAFGGLDAYARSFVWRQ